jgi:hypothetical protein
MPPNSPANDSPQPKKRPKSGATPVPQPAQSKVIKRDYAAYPSMSMEYYAQQITNLMRKGIKMDLRDPPPSSKK